MGLSLQGFPRVMNLPLSRLGLLDCLFVWQGLFLSALLSRENREGLLFAVPTVLRLAGWTRYAMIPATIIYPGLPLGSACPPLLPGILHLDVFPRPDFSYTNSLELSTCVQASITHPFLLYWWSQLCVGKRVLKTFLFPSINTEMLNMTSFRKLTWIHCLSKRDPNRPTGKET